MKHDKDSQKNTVLIIGGGIGGIKAALDLSEAGQYAILVDKAASIGGLLTELDRTFPTNNCDICTLSPNLSEQARIRHIDLMPMTRVISVSGEEGNFEVTLETRPRFIDMEKCTACGYCLDQFPRCVRFSPGLDHRAPTCMRYPKATPYAFSIDMNRCDDMDSLAASCPFGAILKKDAPVKRTCHVRSIILAMGGKPFSPTAHGTYGYGKLPNVVSSLEYERIMSASGPTFGDLRRPSDGKKPEKIAWIQCVGSRGTGEQDVSYCSGACCMFALKEAIVTKERFKENIETTIFYMDMRTFGKGYESYLNNAVKDHSIRLVRCRPHTLLNAPGSEDIEISYLDDESGFLKKENYDMVVLSSGFRPIEEAKKIADILGISLNRHAFAQSDPFNPVLTSRTGIYVCGVFEGPKDIPDTIAQASAAAAQASGAFIVPPAEKQPLPEMRSFENDQKKMEKSVGVFVCDCGQNISGTVDISAITEYAKKLPGVVTARMTGYGCSRESVESIKNDIDAYGLDRVVVGGCSPRTHESLFQSLLERAGINKYMLEIANLRDQNAWVHKNQTEQATLKAKDLLRMAVAAVMETKPLKDQFLRINKHALVLGGGVTGMNTALILADRGCRVHLVEQQSSLGGIARFISKTIEGGDVAGYLENLIRRVRAHGNIEVLLNAIVVDHEGIPGKFRTGFQIGPRLYYRSIEHGVVILATGAKPYWKNDYLLGKHDGVMTQMDLGVLLSQKKKEISNWKQMVMIQCVGSRNEKNPNCSRVCCQAAIKNALHSLKENPDLKIYVLYRDIRTYGFMEDYYIEAREKGVIFVQYHEDEPPKVKENGTSVDVTFREPLLQMDLKVRADCLVLSTGFRSEDEGTEDLARIFGLDRTQDGYFLESHVKLKPVEISVPGFFVAGTAHSPKLIRECIVQAQAAAGRALGILTQDTINLGANIATVDKTKCATCLACVRICPYDVPFINEDRYSQIEPSRCRGCGMCAAECPAKAIQLMQFEDDPMLARLERLLERIGE